jgi:hypothetical protein
MEDQEALDLAADWADISQGLRKDLGHQLFSQWIRPIQLGTFCKDTGTLNLFLPTEFSANWVQDRFHDRLSLAWKIARSEVKNVKIAVHPGRRKLADLDFKGEDGFGHRAANDGSNGGSIAGGLAMESIGEDGFTSSVGLDPSLTFAAFVTGSTNVLAKNAAERMAVAEKPQFSPLYLKAATGQGKTHLLHAIGHSYLQAHPRARIFYCSAERFMVEFVSALKSNEMIEFKARLRGFDLLLVDDIQFIIGKASAQEELLYTIDALLAEGKRLVFAADRAPQALDGVEPRLLSRLSMGLVADIQAADIDLRRADPAVEARALRPARRAGRRDRVPRANDQPQRPRARRRAQQADRLRPADRAGGLAAARRRAADRHPFGQPAADHHRRDPAHGVPVLPHRSRRDVEQAPRPRGGAPAAGGDVPRQSAHPALVSGDRTQVRRARPLDGDPCRSADRGPEQARCRHGRRRAQPAAAARDLTPASGRRGPA